MNSKLNRIAALVAVLSLVFATAGLAGRPVKEDIDTVFLGLFIGDCGSFNVLSDSAARGHIKLWFDREGNLTRLSFHANYDTIYYSDADSDSFLASHGEVENTHIDYIDGTIAVTGVIYKLTIPGYGVVFHEAGRLVIDLETDEILFEAGPSDFHDENLDALCAALAP